MSDIERKQFQDWLFESQFALTSPQTQSCMFAAWQANAEELTRLQSEVERLRGRLNQINNLVALRWSNGVPTHSEMLEEVEQLSKPGTGNAWLLRTQAEAVQAFLLEQAPLLDRYRPHPINEKDHCCEFNLLLDRERLHLEAERLRQQAAESENGAITRKTD